MSELSKKDIEKLKEVFGPLHKISIEGTSYIVRTLNRKDLAAVKLFDEDQMTPDKEDAIIKLSLIHPRDIDMDNISAGTISSIVELVLDKSGILSLDSLQNALTKARTKRTVFNEIYENICCAFPAILPGDLDVLTIDKLMELLVMAEGILMMQGLLEEELEFKSTEDDEEAPVAKSAEDMENMLQNALQQAQSKGYI